MSGRAGSWHGMGWGQGQGRPTPMNSSTSTGQPSKMHAPYSCTILLSKFNILSSSSSCACSTNCQSLLSIMQIEECYVQLCRIIWASTTETKP